MAAEPFAVSPLFPEADLVGRARSGDQDAFRELWTGAHRRAHGLCLRLTGNHADAADALQETQIAVWRHLGRFDGRCPFDLWVLAIARNAARALLRARGRRPEPVADVETDAGPVRSGPFAEAVAETGAVQDALERLPEQQREAVLLRAGDMSYEQIAAVMDAPVASVRVWVHRARTRLRSEMAH